MGGVDVPRPPVVANYFIHGSSESSNLGAGAGVDGFLPLPPPSVLRGRGFT